MIRDAILILLLGLGTVGGVETLWRWFESRRSR